MTSIDAAIITGAGRGIGKSIAIELGKHGITVICISKSKNCILTSNEIKKNGGIAEALECDISNYENAERSITEFIKNKPYKRIAVILAAGVLGPKGPFISSKLKEWDKCIETNLLGNLAILHSLLPKMLKCNFGRIVLFAGGGSAYAFPMFPAYSVSKTALVRFTENLNEDLKDKGDFSVVCLAPGAVETDMLKEVRACGAEIKTIVDISEPIQFVKEFVISNNCTFSGSFIHVRDNWKDYLNSTKELTNSSLWKLRRIE